MSRGDRESKERQEKFQNILTGLLRDDDNKYCVDCDAKGPRWASWNLGIFLCIRCAGIHRNLGVHISKVKSVTLDTWTSEQVAMVQDMGNSRARAVYEANIPDNFRRPQSDSALEAFIRAKYEQKKYIASEWVPPKPRSLVLPPDDTGRDKKVRPRATANVNVAPQRAGGPASHVPPPVSAEAHLRSDGSQPNKPPEAAKPPPAAAAPSAQVDLLGLETPIPAVTSNYGSDDLFSDFLSSSSCNTVASGQGGASVNPASQAAGGGSSAELSDAGLFNGVEEKKASTKDAIMALFGPAPTASGGAYMNNQQMMNMMAPPTSGMIGMVPAGTGMQMVGGMPMQQPMMMMPPGMMPMMNMPQHQQQYMAAQQQQQLGMPAASMAGMPGGVNGMPAAPQQYAMQAQHMYSMQQIQNQMGSMNLVQDPTGGMGGGGNFMGPTGPAGTPLGGPAAPAGMAGGQGWGQHPSMATYPVPAAAPGNVWQ